MDVCKLYFYGKVCNIYFFSRDSSTKHICYYDIKSFCRAAELPPKFIKPFTILKAVRRRRGKSGARGFTTTYYLEGNPKDIYGLIYTPLCDQGTGNVLFHSSNADALLYMAPF